MKISNKLPFEINLRFSELEKTILNLKSLKKGDILEGKIVKKDTNSATIDFGKFRIKANIKFSFRVGETLKLRVKDVSPSSKNVVFELLEEKFPQDKAIEHIGKAIAERDFALEKFKSVLKEILNLSAKNPEAKEVLDKIFLHLTVKEAENSALSQKVILKIVENLSKTDIERIVSMLMKKLPDKKVNEFVNLLKDNSIKAKNGIKEFENLLRDLLKEISGEKGKVDELFKLKFEKSVLENNLKTDELKLIKENISDLIKALKTIKDSNIAVKTVARGDSSTPVLSNISIIIPFFISTPSLNSTVEFSYEYNNKKKKYSVKTVFIKLSMSNLGDVSVVIERMEKLLKVVFHSSRKDIVEFLKSESDELEKKISAYIKNVKIFFKEDEPKSFNVDDFSTKKELDITV